MYILLINSEKGHKQRYCDKIVHDPNDGSITVWNYPDWEWIPKTYFTSYSIGDDSLLLRPIESWEWENWHSWDECSK